MGILPYIMVHILIWFAGSSLEHSSYRIILHWISRYTTTVHAMNLLVSFSLALYFSEMFLLMDTLGSGHIVKDLIFMVQILFFLEVLRLKV